MAAGSFKSTPAALRELLEGLPRKVIAIEVGGQSAWVSRLLEELGHEALVANPRQLPIIFGGTHKSDELDAENLARLARFDRKLLKCIRHRGERSQRYLDVMRSREQLVKTRTALINHVRGIAKSAGHRLAHCSPRSFHLRAAEELPAELLPAARPLLAVLETVHTEIRGCDERIESWQEEEIPEVAVLRQVDGVGPLTAAAFILTIEDPRRFEKCRQVGAYLGLTPRRDQSGKKDRQCGITKAGNDYLRRLLVNSAQYILNRGPDCDLRRFGEAIYQRGGGRAYKTAVVAVARKLSVLLLSLWRTGEVYERLREPGRQRVRSSARASVV